MRHKFTNILECLWWLVSYTVFILKLYLILCHLWHNFRIQKFILRVFGNNTVCSMISKEHTHHSSAPCKWFWGHRVIHKLRTQLSSVISREVQILKFQFFSPKLSPEYLKLSKVTILVFTCPNLTLWEKGCSLQHCWFFSIYIEEIALWNDFTGK